MGIRFHGDISIDVADYDGDIEISIDDASDINDLMYQNNITIDELMEYNDVEGTCYESVISWIEDGADQMDLAHVVEHATRQLKKSILDDHEARQSLFKEINELKSSKSELVKAIKQFDSTFPDDS